MVGLHATEHWTAWRTMGDDQKGEHQVHGYGLGFVVADEEAAIKLCDALEKATGDIEIESVFAG